MRSEETGQTHLLNQLAPQSRFFFKLLTPYSLTLSLPFGAGDGIRTRDPQLGRLMLYQLSYTRLKNG